MANGITRFLGDSPGRVAIKLIVVSFVVGIVLTAMNWTPLDFLYRIWDMLVSLWNMGFEAIERFFNYFLMGAIIVIPAFVLLRILNFRRT
ncbi:MAG: DUF6460 domain-containing protein [Notoacmeibacter sp.]|nr:DUF6460 domain-containing protein [Notoacmeibacter sp.]